MFGTGTGEDAGSGVQPLSYEGSSSDTDALGKQVKDLYLNSPSDLPTSGCASYDGVIAFATTGEGGAPEDFAGEVARR